MTYASGDATAFHGLLAAHSRLIALALAPDGTRLILSVQSVDEEGTGHVSRLWEVDPAGQGESRLVARSVEGDRAPAFAADGTLLFLSGRENTDSAVEESDRRGASLWALPESGEAKQIVRHMQERGRGQYGGQPYRDVIALTDAALARADLDATRTALAGWSYGGYLANRAATLTDRFKAIVSYAGMWNLESLQAGTDMHAYFRKIFGDPRTQRERYDANSPHLDAARITTPVLIVHGGKDYRVSIGQSLSLHSDLQRLGVPVRLLHFPTEGHTIGAPNHIRIMYETVLNFLDHHVLGQEWRRPAML